MTVRATGDVLLYASLLFPRRELSQHPFDHAWLPYESELPRSLLR
jgi:hypothetical protein